MEFEYKISNPTENIFQTSALELVELSIFQFSIYLELFYDL